ncbi:MAG TPA: putative nucleotide-diphospho-sugar transferase [Rhodopila sp.]|nr:putative nucleotide-diphospho-sugar transferase [Rhodopila sp.]
MLDAATGNHVRTTLTSSYAWPPHMIAAAMPLYDLSAAMDLAALATTAARIHSGREIIFAIVSREYTRIGLNWVAAMRRLGLANFFIVACDEETAGRFSRRGVPNVLARIDEAGLDPSFVSTTGFSAKGLAVSTFKFPVAEFLVRAGYSVVMSDADAVWLRDAMPHLRGADVAFQRIVYHPPAITSLWGFAACGGFLSFRASAQVLVFIRNCIVEQRAIFCDQIAINMALVESGPDWRCVHPDWHVPPPGTLSDQARREALFARCAAAPITAELQDTGCRVLALPHDAFWRHSVVTPDPRTMIVGHPNSPKDDAEKIKLLESFNLRFVPAEAEPPPA